MLGHQSMMEVHLGEVGVGFADLVQGLVETDSGVSVNVPDSWRQGRTAYGGLTAGLSLAATNKQSTALVSFIGPVAGDPAFSSELLRQGKNVSSYRVDGAMAASCNFFFGASRESVLNEEFNPTGGQEP